MCRAIAYLGPALRLSAALHEPDNSLVRQSYEPQQLHMLNLAGCGVMAWMPDSHEPAVPLVYRSTTLPIYDANLESLAAKTTASCVLAHIRGIPYRVTSGYGPQNLHPFCYPGYRLALAHNGDLAQIKAYRPLLLKHVKPEIAVQIRGTTDSEWVYALLMSQLDDPTARPSTDALLAALRRTLDIIREARREAGVAISSSLNLFLADGERLVALRFTFDFGRYMLDPAKVHEGNLNYLSLWYTAGERYARVGDDWTMVGGGDSNDAVLVASEPLTRDRRGWVEVPEYSALVVETTGTGREVRTVEFDIA